MTRKKQPKYAVGQVVRATDGSFCKLRNFEGRKTLFNLEGFVYSSGGKAPWYHRSELRPLTAREIGPLAQRKRAGRRRGPR